MRSSASPTWRPGLVGAEKAARGKRPTDVWFHTIVPTTGAEKTGYPTQKPEGVLRRLVAASARPGGWCLDPFAGSGTLGAVCQKLGRRFVLIDHSPDAVGDHAPPARCRGAEPGGSSPSRLAHERHEPDRLERLPADGRATATGANEVLVLPADRRDQPASDAELRLEGGRASSRVAAARLMASNGACSGSPRDPSPVRQVTFSRPSSVSVRAARSAQLGMAFDRPHVSGEAGEQRGVVARAGADVEHPVVGGELEQLEHPGHDQRLGDRLVTGDGQRDVLVGAVPIARRDKALARHTGDGGQDALVSDGGAGES